MEQKKPEWLQALEAQSWQAELIASGLAIYGSFTLGPYIEHLTEWAVLRFNDRVLTVLYFLFIYLFAAQVILVISFITHLALRILWAGILGLSSVYPDGINMQSKTYADYFKQQLKLEFPDLSKYSLELDKLCSLIFSILCALVIVMLSTSIWILIYLVISELALKIIPTHIFNYIQYSIFGIILVLTVVNGILVGSKWKNTAFAKKHSYNFNRRLSKIIMILGYRSFNYITQTIRSNVTSKLFFIGMTLILIGSMTATIPKLQKMVPFYRADIFVHYKALESTVESRSYADQNTSSTILLPYIQSEIIDEDYLNLYIPFYQRELSQFEKEGGTFTWNNELSSDENKVLRAKLKVKNANSYYSVQIDGQPLPSVTFSYRRNLHNNRDGYQAFIDLSNYPKGKHVLTINSKYTDENGKSYTRSIPFYKTATLNQL